MKPCPYCGRTFPDDVDECPFDQQRLAALENLETLAGAQEEQNPGWFPPEVLSKIALWWLAKAVFAVMFSFAGIIFLNLIAAIWAGFDCAKMQTRGSKVLGIAFKPIVVFPTCACLLGFTWYLILRHRVKTSALELPDKLQIPAV